MNWRFGLKKLFIKCHNPNESHGKKIISAERTIVRTKEKIRNDWNAFTIASGNQNIVKQQEWGQENAAKSN